MNSIHYVVILNNNGVQMAKNDLTKAALASLNKVLQEENEALKKRLEELEKKEVAAPVIEKVGNDFSWKQHFAVDQVSWIENNVKVDIVGNYWRFKMPSKVAASKIQKFLSAAGIRCYSTIEYNVYYLKFLK